MKFNEPLAQAEYERLLSDGMESGEAHQEVELKRIAGHFTPPELRTRPRLFAIVGSDDQKRIARLAAVKQMAEQDPERFDQYKRQANAAGVDITGKSYNSGLAAYQGDPDAWVKDDSDVKSIARMKGFEVGKEDGLIKIGVPLDLSKSIKDQMLSKKRLTKPVVKKRKAEGKPTTKAGSWSRGVG